MSSSANLDLVRSIYADWERGDFSRADWADPDIETVAVGGPEPGAWTGIGAMATAWRDFLSAWTHYRVTGEQFRELEDGRVLAFNLIGGSGRGSGLDVGQTETKGANLFHLRGGSVTKLVIYWRREQALADLGLSD